MKLEMMAMRTLFLVASIGMFAALGAMFFGW